MNKASLAPPYLAGNIRGWSLAAADYVQPAIDAWSAASPYWGVYSIPDEGLGLLPADMTGMRAVELGCGAAYVSAWMCRRGAEVVAIDPTPAQLATARMLQEKHQLEFTIQEGYAESTGFPDGSFDFAVSEYGAALWADPCAWIPEAARILRPGGQLVFLSNSALMVMCAPDNETDGPVGEAFLRPYFGMHKTVWPDYPDSTEFHLTHSAWIDLLRENHFRIDRLLELQVPEGATTRYPWADAQWGRKWPLEEVWMVTRE